MAISTKLYEVIVKTVQGLAPTWNAMLVQGADDLNKINQKVVIRLHTTDNV